MTPLGELTDSIVEPLLQALEPVPEPLAAAEHDRDDDDVQVVDQVGGEELADRRRAAADPDVEAARRLGAPRAPPPGWRR